jgi:hypothetical protein
LILLLYLKSNIIIYIQLGFIIEMFYCIFNKKTNKKTKKSNLNSYSNKENYSLNLNKKKCKEDDFFNNIQKQMKDLNEKLDSNKKSLLSN